MATDVKALLEQLKEAGVLDALRQELASTPPPPELTDWQHRPETDEEAGGGVSGLPLIYWKRRDGRITISDSERAIPEYRKMKGKGYIPLPQYGVLPSMAAHYQCCSGIQVRQYPLHALMARGGAKEIPLVSILAASWHKNPPSVHGKTVEFPQLSGLVIEEVFCDECDKEFAAEKGERKHLQALRDHCRAAHNMRRDDVEFMLQRQGLTLGSRGQVRDDVPLAEPAAVYQCDICHKAFSTKIGCTGHKRSHRVRGGATAIRQEGADINA